METRFVRTLSPFAERAGHIAEAILSWSANACYLDNAGNYRIKATRRIAEWNRDAKRAFPSCTDLHEAAQAFLAGTRSAS